MGKAIWPLLAINCGGVDELHLIKVNQNYKDLITWARFDEISQNKVEKHSYIVAFNPSVTGLATSFVSYQSEYLTHYNFLDEKISSLPGIKGFYFITSINLQSELGKKQEEYLLPSAFLAPSFRAPANEAVASLIKVDFQDEYSARKILKTWAQNSQIWFAEPNYIRQLDVENDMFKKLSSTYQEKQDLWWLTEINLYQAYAEMSGLINKSDSEIRNNPPLIAVMDSGVDYEHHGLMDSFWRNPNQGHAGCIEDLYGCNTLNYRKGFLGNGNVYPATLRNPGEACDDTNMTNYKSCVHGTHVAGLIAGKDDFSESVAGICPWCKLMTLRIVDDSGRIPDIAILNALKYISYFKKNGQNQVRVINCSFSDMTSSRSVELLVRNLSEQGSSTLLIGAAGNKQTMKKSYPAAAQEAIAVASTNKERKKSLFSNFGTWVDISAPGGDQDQTVTSFAPGNKIFGMCGTSQAAPIVAGVAGLILTVEPDISFDSLRSRLINTANPVIYDVNAVGVMQRERYYRKMPGESERRAFLGAGLIDAAAAIKNEQYSVTETKSIDWKNISCSVLGQNYRGTIFLLKLLLMPILFVGLRLRQN